MKLFKQTLRDVPLDGQTVLVRADFDSDAKIRANLPTIKYLLDRHCKVIIISSIEEQNTLEPAATKLATLLKRDIRFVDKTVGDKAHQAIKKSPKIGVTVLENLRFHEEEEKNDPEFARRIAKDTGASYFVQDNFNLLHRKHASMNAITHYIPGVIGLALENELKSIAKSNKSRTLPGLEGLLDAKT